LAKEEKAMNFQLISVSPINPITQSDARFTENHYVGIAIEERGRYYYWAKGVSIEIAEWEYQRIKKNPKLYYFSTALKLHFQIEKQLKQENTNGL